MKSVKLYVPETEEIILAVEGTGDNLLPEDEEQGYVDYIMFEVFKIDGTTIDAVDGGQIMLTKMVVDMPDVEFLEEVLNFCGIEREKVKEL